MPFSFWETHRPVTSGVVLDPQCLSPKLSVRIADELHMRLKLYAVQHRVSLQALVVEALEDRLRKPVAPPKPRVGDLYRPGTDAYGGSRPRENAAARPLAE